MNPIQESTCEQISALADGALKGDALARAVDALCVDDRLQQTWQTHHAIGDLLRNGARQPCTDSSAFLARFQQRLAIEAPSAARPAVPQRAPAPSVTTLPPRRETSVKPSVPSVPIGRVEAANEPVFRWKLLAGVASLAAAAAIGWNWVGVAVPSSGAQLAQQQTRPESSDADSVLVATQVGASRSGNSMPLEPTRVMVGGNDPQQVMLRDARLDQLIEAHRQAGGAAQMPSGFLRNATFDGSSR